MKRVVGVTMVGAAMIVTPAVARASDTYPGRLQEELDLPCVPQCTVCHLTPAGGNDTARKRFALTMKVTGGLKGEHPELLRPALEKIQQAGDAVCWFDPTTGVPEYEEYGGALQPGPCDSDHDGTADVEELRRGNDPNVPGEGRLCGPDYGCGARIEPHGRANAPAALVAAAAVFALAFSRRFRAP